MPEDTRPYVQRQLQLLARQRAVFDVVWALEEARDILKRNHVKVAERPSRDYEPRDESVAALMPLLLQQMKHHHHPTSREDDEETVLAALNQKSKS